MNLSWQSMPERERRMVVIGAVCAALLLLLGVVLPLDRSVARAREHLVQKQSDLAWMQSVGPSLAAAGPALTQTATSQESLLVTVDRTARAAGLGSALTSSEPAGANGLRVRLEKAPFDIMVGWLAQLAEQQSIGVESATIDNVGTPGVVNAGLVLRAR